MMVLRRLSNLDAVVAVLLPLAGLRVRLGRLDISATLTKQNRFESFPRLRSRMFQAFSPASFTFEVVRALVRLFFLRSLIRF